MWKMIRIGHCPIPSVFVERSVVHAHTGMGFTTSPHPNASRTYFYQRVVLALSRQECRTTYSTPFNRQLTSQSSPMSSPD
jgi:hypothetical protein